MKTALIAVCGWPHTGKTTVAGMIEEALTGSIISAPAACKNRLRALVSSARHSLADGWVTIVDDPMFQPDLRKRLTALVRQQMVGYRVVMVHAHPAVVQARAAAHLANPDEHLREYCAGAAEFAPLTCAHTRIVNDGSRQQLREVVNKFLSAQVWPLLRG